MTTVLDDGLTVCVTTALGGIDRHTFHWTSNLSAVTVTLRARCGDHTQGGLFELGS